VTYGRTNYRVRIRWFRAVVVLAAVAAIAAFLDSHLLGSSTSTASTPATIAAPVVAHRSQHRAPPLAGRTALGEADGAIPDGTTIFDDQVPGVANLDPALLAALRQASGDAGVPFVVDSGWRSAAYQQHLLQDAVSQYGSQAEAARWVATPDTSAHVSGDAVDLGSAAAAWLSQHGAAYGLCQIYANESWHFELRPDAADDGCPAMYPDPTYDPRMQQ